VRGVGRRRVDEGRERVGASGRVGGFLERVSQTEKRVRREGKRRRALSRWHGGEITRGREENRGTNKDNDNRNNRGGGGTWRTAELPLGLKRWLVARADATLTRNKAPGRRQDGETSSRSASLASST
jgi:hypothetical protein